MQKFILPTLIGLIMATAVTAQFTTNPAENTVISDAAGEQAIPKIATCSDGSIYVCWFSSESGNYNVRMQYLDQNGNAQWQPNGILISDQPQESSLTNYSMIVDPENHAVVTFQDIRMGTNNPVAYRVSPSGQMVWGADGILLSNNTNYEPVPMVCATGDGNLIFAWQSLGGPESEVRMQKISADGNVLWGDGIFLSEAGINYAHPYLLPAEGDNVFLIWHKETGPFFSPNRGLYVQQLDENGNFIYPSDVEIYAPVPSSIVHYLDMTTDDNGGVVFTWYGNDVGTHFNSWVQHMASSGSLSFPANGVVVATSMTQNHMYPSSAWLPQTQEIITYFSEQDLNQNQRGLYAQKFNLQGERLWGESGKVLIPLSSYDYSLPKADGFEDKAICIFEAFEFGNFMDSEVRAVALNSQGDFVWQENYVTMSSAQSQKLHRTVSRLNAGQWVAVWGDERGSSRDIYAQNIRLDGSLGPGALADGKLQGFVRDAVTNLSISSATIYLTNADNGYQTNTTPFGSHFSIVISAGTYNLECEADGYQTLEINEIVIGENSNSHQNLYLMPADAVTGISDNEKNNVRISPNPFDTYMSFDLFNLSGVEKIEIRNTQGEIVKSISANDSALSNYTIETIQLPAGIYVYNIITKKKIFSGKLIKY
jgi:hypothetical protein